MRAISRSSSELGGEEDEVDTDEDDEVVLNLTNFVQRTLGTGYPPIDVHFNFKVSPSLKGLECVKLLFNKSIDVSVNPVTVGSPGASNVQGNKKNNNTNHLLSRVKGDGEKKSINGKCILIDMHIQRYRYRRDEGNKNKQTLKHEYIQTHGHILRA